MKKICLFANSMFKIGGEQRISSYICNHFIEQGFEVTVIIKVKEKVDYNLYHLSKKVKLYFLNHNYSFRLNNTRFVDLLRTINRKTGIVKNNPNQIRHFFCSDQMLHELTMFFQSHTFDYVIGVSGDRSFILSYLKPFINGKLIYWNHQTIRAHFKEKNTRYFMEDSFIQKQIKQFDEVIVLSKDDKTLLDNYYHLNCVVIPNCNSFISKKKSTLDHNRFIAVGRLTYQKGFDLLIKSMKIFISENKNYTLDIFGEGKDNYKLNRMIKKNHLQNYIHILKPNKNIQDIYQNYDACLVSSRYEGFGLVTLEAMECGLPIIGYQIPINKEIIKNNQNGLLVSCFDINKYAEAMLKIASSYQYRKNLSLKLPESTKNYNQDIIKNKWDKIIF